MSAFGIYRLGAVVFTFAGLRAEEGVVSVTISPREDDFTEEVAPGLVNRAETENEIYDVELVLKAACNFNQVLAGIRNADRSTDGGAGVAPMAVADPNGASLFGAEISYIRRPADLTFAAERGDVTWTFTAITKASAYIPGGNAI